MSAFNGSGTFVIGGVGLPYVTGTTISSTVANQLNTDLATGLSNCITKDGQTTPTANIPMGGFKVTGLGVATAQNDALSYNNPATVSNLTVNNNMSVINNVGVGFLPNVNWNAQYNVVSIGASGSVFGEHVATRDSLYLTSNSYIDGVGRRYISANPLAEYYLASGQHIWYTAPTGAAGAIATTTQRAMIDNAGNFGIGPTAPGGTYILEINQNQNAASGMTLVNTSAGVAAQARCVLNDGTNITLMSQFGEGFTPNGILNPGCGVLLATKGLAITAQAGGILFGTNGNVETARFENSLGGSLIFGTPAAATAAGMDASGKQVYAQRGFYAGGTGGIQWDSGTFVQGTASTNIKCTVINNGVILNPGATSWAAISDDTLKTPLTPFSNALAKVASIGVGIGRYLTDDPSMSRSFASAQDVQAVLPEAVDIDPENDTLLLRYQDIIPLLIAALAEQVGINAGLEARLTAAGI